MNENFNFTDLILLVGTNPLPNYVVLKYAILNKIPLKRVCLVHSEGQTYQSSTKEFAERIRDIIKKEFPELDLQFQLIHLSDLSSMTKIQNDLNSIWKNTTDNTIMHLNYTGGTKTMAVHVYRYLEKNCKERHLKITFSYLDGRKHKLVQDESGDESGILLEQIGISLEDLINLHKYQKDKGKGSEENFLKASEVIQEIIPSYLEWQRRIIRKYYYSTKDEKTNFIKKTKDFLENNNLLSDKEELIPTKVQEIQEAFALNTESDIIHLLQVLPQPNILDESGKLWIPEPGYNNENFRERTKIVKDYLAGKWLEYYVVNILREKLQTDKITADKYKAGLIKVESNWEIAQGTKCFEIDVILINGYQICGISCTTDKSQNMCKSKAFEILHRTSQFGGEEAKAILITALSNESVEEFSEDINRTTGSSKSKFLVLGEADLQKDKLWEKIKNHIWEV